MSFLWIDCIPPILPDQAHPWIGNYQNLIMYRPTNELKSLVLKPEGQREHYPARPAGA